MEMIYVQCIKCKDKIPKAARFCESCGSRVGVDEPSNKDITPVISVTTACKCGAAFEAIDSQSFCSECGRRYQQPKQDRLVIKATNNFSAITDRGIKHAKNEDYVALGIEDLDGSPIYIMVVCDGLSSSQKADKASEVAAKTACSTILSDIKTQNFDSFDPNAMIVKAIEAANTAVCSLDYDPNYKKDPPSTTIVMAIIYRNSVTIGWVGDSRAYWVTPYGEKLLTHDHSWLNEVIALGKMTEQEALMSPRMHEITKCLGIFEPNDTNPSLEPSVISYLLPETCWLILCSDGLWNYAPYPKELAKLLHQFPKKDDAHALSENLIEFALSQGGRDNITVAILSYYEQFGVKNEF